jgi:hypothetical protein
MDRDVNLQFVPERSWRWYWLVAALLLVGNVFGFLLLEARLRSVADAGQAALLATLLLWSFWCCPYLEAGTLTPRWTRLTPRRALRVLRWAVWVPAVFLTLAVVVPWLVDWAASPYYTYGGGSHPRSPYALRRLTLGEWMALGLVMPVIPCTLWLSRSIRGRLLRTVGRKLICFECGYDLRGNPSGLSCPECGAKIARP